MGLNSFGTNGRLAVGGTDYTIERLDALPGDFGVERLPYSLKVLLENLLRHEDGKSVTADDISAFATAAQGGAEHEIAFSPARILLQDFTGVPCVVDLAALRDAVGALGGDPGSVNPQIPVDLVIDHSVIVDVARRPDAAAMNAHLEFARNGERYRFLRWGQQAFSGLRVVPPDTGICHQVNLELLSKVVFADSAGAAYPDTLVGTDSHTTMVNGLGVVGWGVGGIEAEAAMLGQPVSMLVPKVVGLRLEGALTEGATATDLVLTIAELLRDHGVVGKFVECYGDGIANVPLENRATIGNMSPEYGSTVTIFPIDAETLRYLRFTGRPESLVRLVEAYAKQQGLWHDPAHEAAYAETITLDLSTVVPSLAGPARPQDRVPLDRAKESFRSSLAASRTTTRPGGPGDRRVPAVAADGSSFELTDGSVVIAAVTSCTNTSNPQVMIAAGLLAETRRRTGAHGEAVGEDLARPGLTGRRRLLRPRRAHAVSREARFRDRRLRLHDVHRQLGPVGNRGLGGDRRRRPHLRRRALGQP